MLKTDYLRQYLKQYASLPLHQNETLKQNTQMMMAWQKSRLTQLYPDLFNQPEKDALKVFMFDYFYDLNTLEMLAKQLKKALDQKIKLDRWIPNEILDSALAGFELALTTLQTDSAIAQHLMSQQLEINDTNVLKGLAQINQNQIRIKQLDLLHDVTQNMHRFAQSLLLRSALKFARSKIEQRGFKPLHDYLQHTIQIMRTQPHTLDFFHSLVKRDKLFLNYLAVEQPTQLNIYYDANIDQFIKLSQQHMDMC